MACGWTYVVCALLSVPLLGSQACYVPDNPPQYTMEEILQRAAFVIIGDVTDNRDVLVRCILKTDASNTSVPSVMALNVNSCQATRLEPGATLILTAAPGSGLFKDQWFSDTPDGGIFSGSFAASEDNVNLVSKMCDMDREFTQPPPALDGSQGTCPPRGIQLRCSNPQAELTHSPAGGPEAEPTGPAFGELEVGTPEQAAVQGAASRVVTSSTLITLLVSLVLLSTPRT